MRRRPRPSERHPLSRFTQARRAFTLVELTLVLAILAVVTALTTPRYLDAMQRYRARLAAQHLAATINLVRDHARLAGATTTITFDFTTDTLTSTMPDPDRPGQTISEQYSASPYEADLTAGASSSISIAFDLYGTPSVTGAVSVTVGSETRLVALDESGRTKVQ